jgi:hypothetical protein
LTLNLTLIVAAHYDHEIGEMYVTNRSPYELVSMCHVTVAPLSQGERITTKANDIYVPKSTEQPADIDTQAMESDEIPF